MKVSDDSVKVSEPCNKSNALPRVAGSCILVVQQFEQHKQICAARVGIRSLLSESAVIEGSIAVCALHWSDDLWKKLRKQHPQLFP